jgi:hypothetical protein
MKSCILIMDFDTRDCLPGRRKPDACESARAVRT